MPPVWEQPHESPPKIEVEPEPAPVEDFQSPETTPVEEPEPMEVENVPAPSVESVSNAFEVVDTPEPPVKHAAKKASARKRGKSIC